MKYDLLRQAAKFNIEHKRKSRWHRAVSVAAAVVVFCTTYSLILPAITMERDIYCGLEEHVHDSSCYMEESMLTCGLEESEEAHLHTEECFGGDGKLTCSLEETQPHSHSSECYKTERILACETDEHSHTESCFVTPSGDSSADVETAADWETMLASLKLGKSWPEDVLTIAKSQLGYRESTLNYVMTEAYEIKGYTRYGAWLGNKYGDWNQMFAAFCLHYAKVEALTSSASAEEWIGTLSQEEYNAYHVADYTPRPGDLIFIKSNSMDEVERIGIVSEVIKATEASPPQLKVIEGDSSNTVEYSAYALDSPLIMGYGDLKRLQEVISGSNESGSEATDEGELKIDHSDGLLASSVTLSEAGTSATYEYESNDVTLTLHVEGGTMLPEGIDKGLSQEELWKNTYLYIKQLEENTDTYEQLAAFALENGGNDQLFSLLALELHLLYEDKELDISSYNIEAEIAPKEQLLTPPEASLLSTESSQKLDRVEAAPEAEVGVVVSVLQQEDESISEQDSMLLTAEDAPQPLTFSLNSNLLAVAASQTANPSFTVQYYAYIDQIVLGDNGDLGVIDTSGGKLPQNGKDYNVKYLTLTQAIAGKYAVATQLTLSEIYSPKQCSYVTAPNLSYFNRLYENGHYQLSAIWILKDGKSATSTSSADWTIYTNVSELHFTNRTSSAGENTILIDSDDVIRLVFNTTKSSYTNAAAFYDYDITDGKLYKSASTSGYEYSTQPNNYSYVYGYTREQGINSHSNYGGTGTKLAFGNKNTETGLGELTWDGNTLNMSNANINGGMGTNKIGKGCTFGLVTSLDDKGNIKYSQGVDAPKLFNESTATGKTAFNECSLGFNRTGDAYILSSANGNGGVGVSSLEYFNHPGNYSIWTNNFWPMDGVAAQGHDLRFGSSSLEGYRLCFGNDTDYFPISDDNLDHNSYFGMQYAVQFTLTADYVGPLEYLFFGDDDMWVFLDGRLVCDIGGVHSSVGEYVNLWDYISKGDAGTHTLSFFYTERGASGSSCYMRFTLPSVSSVTPEQNTGTLRIEKQVSGPNPYDQEFSFDIYFTDAEGNKLKDDYSYTRYDSDGTEIKTDIIIYDGGSFQLKDGEYIVVKYLPVGTKYTVTEISSPGYSTTVSINGEASVPDVEATGSISLLKQDNVLYVNTTSYELPETGGTGALPYTLGGILLMSGPLAYGYKLKHKRRMRTAL